MRALLLPGDADPAVLDLDEATPALCAELHLRFVSAALLVSTSARALIAPRRLRVYSPAGRLDVNPAASVLAGQPICGRAVAFAVNDDNTIGDLTVADLVALTSCILAAELAPGVGLDLMVERIAHLAGTLTRALEPAGA